MSLARQEHDAPRGFVTKSEHYAALAEIDRLRDEVAQYREALACDVRAERLAAVRMWMRSSSSRKGRYASQQMAEMLIALVARPVLTHAAITAALYPDKDDPENGAKVTVCHLKAQLVALGGPSGPIINMRATGYALTPEARAWLKQACPEAFK